MLNNNVRPLMKMFLIKFMNVKAYFHQFIIKMCLFRFLNYVDERSSCNVEI